MPRIGPPATCKTESTRFDKLLRTGSLAIQISTRPSQVNLGEKSHGDDGRQLEFPAVLPHSECYRTYRTNSAKNNCTAALVVENGFWSVKRRQALPEGNLPRNSRLETHRC